jgi:3-hydroxyacyl-CoA dehydrogenase
MQMMTDKVGVERDGDVLVILIDNPPINAGSLSVRRGVLESIALLANDPTLRAAVIIGQGSTFVAGSDLREFGKPLEEPQLPAVICAIEQVPKPVVAALHGAALGGGFELALSCDARVAAPGALVGLPEVTLGMIPGAGGTQRLPRLVGVAKGIQLVCSGERITAEKALALGIVDAIANDGLRDSAVRHASGMSGKRIIRDLAVPIDMAEAIESAAKAALKAGRGRPNVRDAIERVQAAAVEPVDVALARERGLFQQYRMGDDAAALRHLFFAEREAAKLPEGARGEARPLRRFGVIGGGTMGAGIAICLAEAGLDVVLIELDAAAVRACHARLQEHWAGRVRAGRCSISQAAAFQARVAVGTDWQALADVDIAIEAVFEDMAAKQDVFRRLDAVLRPGAILASNTSYLDLDVIAAVTARPQDVVGLHFFSPAPVMKLLEIVRSARTSDDVLATAFALARRLKKQLVVARNAFGFIGNRIYDAYRRQCEFMLEEGALPHEIDAALEGFGFAMGPFSVADLSGLDIAWRMRQARAHLRDPKARYVAVADRLCEHGRFGKKTGAGWYSYPEGARRGVPDEVVHDMIRAASVSSGVARRAIGAEEIVRRALGAIVNEAACLVGERVTGHASDIDVILVHGYGFPRWVGGPVHWARTHQDVVRQALDEVAAAGGARFIQGDIATLIS